jgi:uncharacterized protein YbjT (DUF2867 family)
MAKHSGKILLTGATGYVGGRLLRTLISEGADVRVIVRRPEHLTFATASGVEVVRGDLLDRASLVGALDGIHTSYYLVHSMGARGDYSKIDCEAAENFRDAAERASLKRIIYLGGLGQEESTLSPHLRSRQATGRLLASGSVQVIELRASIVLGSGSLSFEMIRALSERLPVMVTPRWVSTMAQPIAIEDLLRYLTLCLDHPVEGHRVYEIGGPDQVSYLGLMREYSRQRGLRRAMLTLPLLSPRLSSLWLGLVTPLYARVGRALIESIRNPTLVRDHSALSEFDVRPMGVANAISRALVNEDREFAETRWSDAMSSSGPRRSWAGVRLGNRLVDYRHRRVRATEAEAFGPILRVGGERGWYFATWLWVLRGWLDLLVGGVGMRRGRRDPNNLQPGDVLDFWRVEEIKQPQLLRLRAEMRLPGRAWLQWEVRPSEAGHAVIHQTAIFDPAGILGLAYWYLIYPLHVLVFAGMLRAIARRAQRKAGGPSSGGGNR